MFRIWANIFFISILKLSVISLCCVFRCRIPRTKTEIEANSRRKYLLKNFNAKLQQIKAADLDDMDYRNGELRCIIYKHKQLQIIIHEHRIK